MFRQIFPQPKCIIGMIALPPLLDDSRANLHPAIERALEDLHSLQGEGVDGVCIENDYDRPHRLTIGPDAAAAFTQIAFEVMRAAQVPVGVQVLLNDWRASLTIAKQVGARFVRLDFFVDRVRIAAGVIQPEPNAVVAFRKDIGAEDVALFTDVQVKHSELLERGKSLSTSIRQAVDCGSDAVVVTGKLTGYPPSQEDLEEAREAAGDFPILVGSGAAPANVADLFRYADGAIVGTSLKNSTAAHERIVPAKVRELMEAVQTVRGED